MAEKIARTVSFRVQGEFITQLAREKLYLNNDFAGAVELLKTCVVSDQLSKAEQAALALRILDGTAAIKGLTGEDYHIETYDEREKGIIGVAEWNKKLIEAQKARDEEFETMQDKYIFVVSRLDSYDRMKINDDYYDEYGEKLFKDVACTRTGSIADRDSMNPMLASFLRRTEQDTDDDYGWLEPDGEFHPVEWANHTDWAGDWLDEHGHENWIEEMPVSSNAGDYLTQKLGWILLHSPFQGEAKPTMAPGQRMTKAQKEFLFDYYTERNRSKEASALYEDDD